MPDFLTELAETHYRCSPRQSLVAAAAERLDDDAALVQAVTSRNLQLRRIAAKEIQKRLINPEFCNRLIDGLAGPADLCVGLLTVLSFVPALDESRFLAAILANLHSADEDVRTAAANVIALQFPEHVETLLPLLAQPGSHEIARILCHSEIPDVLWPLLEYYNFPAAPLPTIIGLLLTPEWLAQNFPGNPTAIDLLIRQFGYADRPATPRLLELLDQGFMYVSEAMTTDPQPAAWRHRLQEFAWALLPWSLQSERNETAQIRLKDPVDVALFLSAARESDRSNLAVCRSRNPLSYRTRESPASVTCMHAPSDYVRRLFIADAVASAQELGIPSDHHGRFAVEHARNVLDIDEESRMESDLLLRTRWTTAARIGYRALDELVPARFPVLSALDFAAARLAVVRAFEAGPDDSRLSPGANSIARLANYVAIPEISANLIRLEAAYASYLVPIGCELQVPLLDKNTSLAWKQALRSFGIPSPRRPEYRAMVEVAFRPALSYHAVVLAPFLLREIGLIACEQEMALHISVQGDLGNAVNYLAFAQLLGRRGRPSAISSRTRVMSKGLVNCNRDVETICLDCPATCRTEIRVYRCLADATGGTLHLDTSFVDDVISTHLIASAMLSDRPGMQEPLDQFRQDLDALVAGLPAVFHDLLHANYYESTGDPRDAELLELLPIARIRREAKEVIARLNLAQELQERCRTILAICARQIHAAIVAESPLLIDGTALSISPYGLPYYFPPDLLTAC